MKFSLESTAPSKIKSDALIIGLYSLEQPDETLKHLDAGFSKELLSLIKNHLDLEGFKGKTQQFVSIPSFGHLPANRLIIVGLGNKPTPTNLRKVGASLHRRLTKQGDSKSFTFLLRTEKLSSSKKKSKSAKSKAKAAKTESTASDTKYSEEELLTALVEGWTLGSFNFDKYKTQNGSDNKKAASLDLKVAGLSLPQKSFTACVKQGKTVGESTNLARALVAEPPAYMTPTRLANEAKRIAKETGLTCTVLNEAQMKKMGMGSMLGVARGADEPPKFIVMKYNYPKSKKKIAIVGKGITFDSGGLSLKTPVGMEKMKYDMAGAAAIIGTMQVIGELKPKVSVMGIVAATENMPSGKAMHPGDVLKALNGKTIEVNNTDAEGRLVLADALTYAVQNGADEVIDLATLTGAIIHALGKVAAGIMGTDDDLIENLVESADKAGEKLWQLPLYEEFKPKLKSDIADLKNAGSRGEAGSCCAAMFLKEFIEPDTSWAHMDIAGVAWSDKDSGEVNKGGTGFGVRTLSKYILSN